MMTKKTNLPENEDKTRNKNLPKEEMTWIRSRAVSRVWRRDETKMSTGLKGECVVMAAYVGLFILFIRGQ